MRSLILLLILVVLLAIFNPGMEDFQAFARDITGEMISGQVGDSGLGSILSGLGGSLAASNIDRLTVRDNYYIFSTYTIDLDGPSREGNEWKFLGIATQFIELHRPDALDRAE